MKKYQRFSVFIIKAVEDLFGWGARHPPRGGSLIINPLSCRASPLMSKISRQAKKK
jgi:hypothetical protein